MKIIKRPIRTSLFLLFIPWRDSKKSIVINVEVEIKIEEKDCIRTKDKLNRITRRKVVEKFSLLINEENILSQLISVVNTLAINPREAKNTTGISFSTKLKVIPFLMV